MNNAQLINATTGNTEYGTPHAIIEAAREVIGGIDLDPASSAIFNKTVRADRYFTKKDDGLSREWRANNLWLNWPFSAADNPLWCAKLLEEVRSRRVHQACVITYACTSEKWFRPLLGQAQCFLIPRTNYMTPDGRVKTGVTKGSCVTYFGRYTDHFAEVFGKLGVVKVPYRVGDAV